MTAVWLAVIVPLSAVAAPYAAMVMDARSGKVLHARNADTQLHPASLTKMMTLYIAFEAVENGELSMDTLVRVSRNAAAEPPSKLGLRAGQKIKLRYLVRAAAVKSANDAATAIAEAISGSEAAFARRMNRTAKALGMTRTTFKNAHGLTETGHMSTARDMTILGRHMLYDYQKYYNIFQRRSTHAGIKAVSNTNRRLLDAYEGADGIKTGYTRAAGFNLVASARRGNERIIATVFGGRSTATRNARVAELLDMGFRRAPSRVALKKPSLPVYQGNPSTSGIVQTVANASSNPGKKAKSIRVAAAAVTKSLRPIARPGSVRAAGIWVADTDAGQTFADDLKGISDVAEVAGQQDASSAAPIASAKPLVRPGGLVLAALDEGAAGPLMPREREVVTRLSTSGAQHWGINIGRYTTKFQAESVLMKTALTEATTLEGATRKVVSRAAGHDANFHGLTREQADLACRRLQARQITCFMVGPN
ncbi:MAG: D-alanyl-D-alanine carboxypeptidase [Rhodobacteraceae bacterium]|nr:D-alanyl-D-alanine carboxypeptidase [Paracoccaceae bacterium]